MRAPSLDRRRALLLVLALPVVRALPAVRAGGPPPGAAPDARPSASPSSGPPAHRAPPAAHDSDREERLRALPYSGWAQDDPDARRVGVTRYVRGSAFEGLNLFALTSRSEAWLVDMDGTRVHSWACDRGQPEVDQDLPSRFRGWQSVTIDGQGALYALVSRDRVLKLAADSRLVWDVPMRAHHDVSLGPDGSVYTLTEELRLVADAGGRRRLILDDDVVRIDPAGVVRSRISLYDVLIADPGLATRLRTELARRYAELDAHGLRAALAQAGAHLSPLPSAVAARKLLAHRRLAEVERALAGDLPADADRELTALLRDVPGEPSDVLHANAVRVLDRAVRGLGRAGGLLVSVRDLDLVAVIDPEQRRLLWSWGPGVIERQHDPSLTPGGDLLLFDNRPHVGASRVVEIAPSSGRIVWSEEGFFSRTRGGGQALPNGDVLIVESDKGRAFEVTRAGATVWEYWNPDEASGRRLSLRQLLRIGGDKAARLSRALGR